MPIITVSRQLGSWGDLIASLVAERLNLTFVDRGMFVSLLQDRGLSLAQALSAESEEMPTDMWGRLAEQRRRTQILLSAILYELALENSMLVVGHGGEVLFKDVGHALCVKAGAPLEVRVARVAAQEAVSEEKAKEMVRHSDGERFAYHKYLFQVDWAEGEAFDLCINTEMVSVLSAVEQITTCAGAPELLPTPASLATLNSRLLANRVALALLLDPQVYSTNIQVDAVGGAVSLVGFVRSDNQRTAATEAALAVSGVAKVQNDLVVFTEAEE